MAKPVCGIFVGVEVLKAVTLKPARKGFRLAGAAVLDLPLDERENPGASLRTLLKKLKGFSGRAVLALSNQHASIHLATLPSTNPDELKSMARFEAERHIPFNAERHSVGFQPLGQGSLEGTPVLLAMVDGPHVDRAMKAATEAKVVSQGLNVSSTCLANSLLFAQPDLARTRTVAIISIGLYGLDLVFVVQGRVVFSRNVPHGLAALVREMTPAGMGGIVDVDRARACSAAKMIDMMDLDKHYSEGQAPPRPQSGKLPGDAARAWVQRIIQELRRSYDFARREMRCPAIDYIALTGEGALLRNLAQYLYVNLNVEVGVLNPIAALAKSDLKGLPFGGLELVTPFGAAVQSDVDGGYKIDLTPETHYRKVERRRLVRNIITTGVLALATAGLGAASYLALQDNRDHLAAAYKDANEQMRPQVKDLREKDKKLTILAAFLDDPSGALPVLNHICGYAGIPGRVSITSVEFEKGKTVKVMGLAAANEDVNSFYDDLKAASLFENVVMRDRKVSEKLGKGRPKVYEFTFDCVIPEFVAKEKKRDAAKGKQGKAGEAAKASAPSNVPAGNRPAPSAPTSPETSHNPVAQTPVATPPPAATPLAPAPAAVTPAPTPDQAPAPTPAPAHATPLPKATPPPAPTPIQKAPQRTPIGRQPKTKPAS